jgi:hypothetical protein
MATWSCRTGKFPAINMAPGEIGALTLTAATISGSAYVPQCLWRMLTLR